jgi:hypothetical protein
MSEKKEARISLLAKNIGFFLTNLPVINRKIEQHFIKSIELPKAVSVRGILAHAYLGFVIYYQARKKSDKVQECISEAIALALLNIRILHCPSGR